MTQITGRWIAPNTVTGTHLRLNNNEMLRGLSSTGTDINLLKITTANLVELQQLFQVSASLPIPSDPKHLATIEYIKNFVQGKTDAKDAVNVYADSNTPLTGASPLVRDDVTLTNGMRIALGANTTGSENGIYDYASSGGTYTLTRSADFDQVDDVGGTEVTKGAYFKIVDGTVYAGWEALLTNNDPIVIGTTALTFVLNPTVLSLVGGDMIAKVGQTFSIDLAAISGLESTNPGNAGGQLRIRTDTALLESNQSTRLDSGTNALVSRRDRKEQFTLTAQNITDQFIDLTSVAGTGSIVFVVQGVTQSEGIDYTVNYTGGASSKTRITFLGGLASGGISALIATDVVDIYFDAF